MVPGLDVAQINSNTWAINPLDRDPAFACHRAYFLSSNLQRAISEPILELARAAFAVSLHKNYSIRAAKRSKDEIGFPFDRFNEMMGRIQQHERALQLVQASLETRVDQRTRELHKEVADRTRAERDLAERTVFLNSLIENSPVAIVVDRSHKLQMCNPAFESLFLYRREDVLGRMIEEIVGSGKYENEARDITNEIKQRKRVHVTLRPVSASPRAPKPDRSIPNRSSIWLTMRFSERREAGATASNWLYTPTRRTRVGFALILEDTSHIPRAYWTLEDNRGRSGISLPASINPDTSSQTHFRRQWKLVYSLIVSGGPQALGKKRSMNPTKTGTVVNTEAPRTGDRRETLTVIDNRTGRQYELPINNDTIRALDLRPIKVHDSDFGMMSYDPAFTNTASCASKITFIDGDKGILRYRGYSIEELAEKSSYLETAYLILYGELPSKSQLSDWSYNITHHTFIHESIKKFLDGFHYDAHPMGMLISTVAALSTFYPDAKDIFNPDSRRKQTYRLIGKMPTLAAFAYRHSLGMPFAYPDNELGYCGNFLNMLFRTTELKYRPNPTLERALDILFILHADHEQNCSSTAMRGVGSSHVDPYSATAAATAALYGPLHGGANEAVLRMLIEIGSVNNVPAYVKRVKAGEKLLMGFGHRVYKNYDPRAKIVKHIAYEVFDVMGRNPLIDIALECERIALEDDYFITRRLYPNVDFYTGLIYQSMGFPVTMFPVLFAIPRTSGWIAQWEEMLLDSEQKISRPRQVYLGHDLRSYIPLDHRT